MSDGDLTGAVAGLLGVAIVANVASKMIGKKNMRMKPVKKIKFIKRRIK